MAATAIWAIVVLALGGLVIWRTERVVRAWIDASYEGEEASTETTVRAAEREFELYLRRQAADDEVALRQAKLRQEAAETNRATLAAADTVVDATAAERQIIAARAAAEGSLAEELLRADHTARRTESAKPSLVDDYAKYLETCATHDMDVVDFPTFAAQLR